MYDNYKNFRPGEKDGRRKAFLKRGEGMKRIERRKQRKKKESNFVKNRVAERGKALHIFVT